MSTRIKQADIPEYVYLELKDHLWRQLIKVTIGDHVLKGSLLVEGEQALHASTSGTITDITQHPSCHRNAVSTTHLVIHSDGLDKWCNNIDTRDPLTLAPKQIEEKIRLAGITGLGGGGFPSASKLRAARQNTPKHLIINAIECEPDINADEAIMQAAPLEILQAALATMRSLTLECCILAIADDKPAAIEIFQNAISKLDLGKQIKLVVVKALFPNGAERQLIEILLDIRLAHNTYPTQYGITCLNVSTLYAIYQAVFKNRALVERVLTLRTKAGTQNIRVHLGTPAHVLFNITSNEGGSLQVQRGGPLTGWLQPGAASVEKGTTGLRWPPPAKALNIVACIRCAKCADICPEHLLPQELLWYSRPLNIIKLNALTLSACLECGLCESVCPSHIPLTNRFRDSKDAMLEINEVAEHAQNASIRVERRQRRIANSGNKVQSQRELRLNKLKRKNLSVKEHNS